MASHGVPHTHQFAPVPAEDELEMHLALLDTAGYTVVPNAIPPPLLARVQAMFDSVVEHPERYPSAKVDGREADKGPGIVEFYRAYEIDPVCKGLMDLPAVFRIAEEAYRRRGGDIRLLSGPVCQHVPAQIGSSMNWHSDGPLKALPAQWHAESGGSEGRRGAGGEAVTHADAAFGGRLGGYLRLTYIISDLPPDGGGTALVPGSHHWPGAGPPGWVNTATGPVEIPGSVKLHGQAGSCMINWTRCWYAYPSKDSLIACFGQALTRVNWMLRTARRHTRTPNLSSVARRIFWQVRISNEQGLVDSYLWFRNTLFLAVLIIFRSANRAGVQTIRPAALARRGH